MSDNFNSDVAFVDESLDSFLEVLSGNQDLQGVPPRACAVEHHLESQPSQSKNSRGARAANSAGFILKEFEGPTLISCFDKTIQLSKSETRPERTKFYRKSTDESNVITLSKFRVPSPLKTCFVKHIDLGNYDKKFVEPSHGKLQVDLKYRNRRRSRRNRFTLLKNEPNKEDVAYSPPLIPSADDIRNVYRMFFPITDVPYIFGCQSSSSDAPCATKCSSRVKKFGLFMELRYVEGQPMSSLVRENIAKIQHESGHIDTLSALIAASAVKTSEPRKTRLIIPVSHDVAGRIATMQKSSEVRKTVLKGKTEPEYDQDACQVVDDILSFIDRTSEFKEIDYDPDDLIKSDIDDVNKSISSVESSENGQMNSPEKLSPRTKRKRRVKSRILRELGKLMNVSITDETSEVEEHDGGVCDEPSCALGCVCSSINDKPSPQEHCGNVDCMFECSCPVRYSYVAEGELSKDEKSWHQTIVRKKNNDVEFQSGIERSKRQKKAPLKYVDAITGRQIDQCFRVRKSRDPDSTQECAPKRRRRTQRDQTRSQDSPALSQEAQTKSDEDELETGESVPPEEKSLLTGEPNAGCGRGEGKPDRSTLSRTSIIKFDGAITAKRLSAVGNNLAKTLDFVYVWCCIHDKYDCYCANWIIMAKTNALLYKPTRLNRYSAQKCMQKIDLGVPLAPYARNIIMFDSVAHCSRSAGCLVNYRARNSTETFNNLMRSKIEHDVLSYSNGFVKLQPVATVLPEEMCSNYPYVTGSMGRSRGVGEVVKMTAPSDEDETICVIDPPKYQPQPAIDPFDDLMIDCASTPSLDLNDELEFHPKPNLKVGSTGFRPCFSLYKRSKTLSSPSKPLCISDQSEKTNSDSDVEIVEKEWDCVSLSSSSDIDVDHDSDVEVSGMQSHMPQNSVSGNSPVVILNKVITVPPQIGGKRPTTEDEFVPSKKHKVDDLTETVITNEEPIVIESDHEEEEDDVLIVDDDDSDFRPTRDTIPLNQGDEISITETREEDTAPSPKRQEAEGSLGESDDSNEGLSSEENGYPNFGLFCMDYLELGYATIGATFSDGSILVKDPRNDQSTKFFRDMSEADSYLKGIIRKFVDPKIKFQPKSKWVKATRGVLMKYKLKKLVIDCNPTTAANCKQKVQEKEKAKPKAKPKPKTLISDTGVRLVVSRKLVPSDQTNFTNKEPTPAKQCSSSLTKLTVQQPGVLLANGMSDDTVKRVVGTFKNMNEATSYIEKNFATKVVQAQPQPPTHSYTFSAATTDAPVVATPSPGVRPGQLTPGGARVMTIQTDAGLRTVVIRAPVPAHVPKVNNVRMSTNSPGFVKISTPTPIRATSIAGFIRPPPVATNAALTQVPVSKELAATSSEQLPLTFSLISDPNGKFTCSTLALPKPNRVRTILPKLTSPQPVPQLKKKCPPRRAEVIVPRDNAFATVISPTPNPVPPATLATDVLSPPEAQVLFNGVVVSKPDPPTARVKGFICDKKSKPSKMISLLPQKPKPTAHVTTIVPSSPP